MLKKRNLIFLSLLILGVFLLTGCWLISTPTYTVTFDSQGGSAVDPQTVERGGLVIEPTAPTKADYTFAGWYKEFECTNAWDFDSDTVTTDVTLYAQWTINSYTVTFNKNGGDTEANPKTKTVAYGGNVGTLPTAPTRTGYTFASWNTKANGSGTKFRATTAVTADITVYAQWTINPYTVNFDSQGGSTVSSQTVNHGGLVSEPTAPMKEGYTFGGWYKESGCTNAWDFATDTVTSDITLYAKWTGSVHNTTQDIYYTIIQLALDAANSNDIIVANDGTYAESITFPDDKVITLQSLNGVSSTTIIGVDGSATVTCSNCPDGTSLEGFIITHNSGETGRGITITIDYLTIKNCNISNNSVTDDSGGGIYNEDGILTITGSSTISNNSAETDGYHGGGIYNEDGTLTIIGSTISDNSTADYGGGIYNEYGTSTITGSTISNNTTNDSGGGIYLEVGTVTITGSTISDNSAADYCGGGIYNSDTLTITDSEISGNSAVDGGGIYHWYGTLTLTGSTISGNTATNSDGGGIYNGPGNATITDSIISSNFAADGGGIYIYDSSPTIQNNTISGNTASNNGGGIFIESGLPTIGGATDADTADFNTICGNIPNQIHPDSYPNNYIFTNCDVIGETGPAGGLIFYDKGEVSDGWRYLEAAPSDQSTGAQWGCFGTLIDGADGTAVGTGEQNTIDIEAGCTTVDTAADICANLGLGGYSDWFLPSKDELNKLYLNKGAIGGFTDDYYWSSSENGANFAWPQYFYNGQDASAGKGNTFRVRAVRVF